MIKCLPMCPPQQIAAHTLLITFWGYKNSDTDKRKGLYFLNAYSVLRVCFCNFYKSVSRRRISACVVLIQSHDALECLKQLWSSWTIVPQTASFSSRSSFYIWAFSLLQPQELLFNPWPLVHLSFVWSPRRSPILHQTIDSVDAVINNLCFYSPTSVISYCINLPHFPIISSFVLHIEAVHFHLTVPPSSTGHCAGRLNDQSQLCVDICA